jgi:hypothetical protein
MPGAGPGFPDRGGCRSRARRFFNESDFISRDHHSPGPFAGRRAIVVGAGNSAVQIAVELATVA